MAQKVPKGVKPEIVYFPIRGKAEQVRLAFHVGGVDFVDTRLPFDEFASKKSDFPFGQLPIMKLNDVTVCQSQALLIYAGRLGGLMPTDAESELLVNQLLCTTGDIETKCFSVFFEPNAEQKREKLKKLLGEVMPYWLSRLDKLVATFGGDSGYCVGEKMTVADINVYACMSWLCLKGGEHGVPKDLCDTYPHIKKVVETMAAHPKVKEWNAKNGQC